MIEMILTSSILILLLVLLRRALRGRIHPGVQYALWLLVALRLLIPGTLFPSPVSLVGAAENLQTTLHQAFPDPADLPAPPAGDLAVQPALPSQAEPRDGDVVVNIETVSPVVTQRVYNWPDVLWKTGIAVTGGALVISNLAFYLRLRRTRKRLELPGTEWSGDLAVYEADGIPSPCLFGLFRPAIYLNEAAMDASHPEHILAHEYAHCRHGDHIWALLRSVCLAVHWYNPLVWWAAILSRRDCELACDAAALRRLGEEERIDYGQTLLSMVSKGRHPAALLHVATTMTAGKRAMTERIALIVKQPKMRKITAAVVAVLACVLVACAFGGKAAAAGLPEECFGVYAPEYWTGGIVKARYYISPRDTSIRIAVREDYFGFVDENGDPVEIERTGLPSIHNPVYTKRKISLYNLMQTGYSTSASYAAQGVWSGYLQDKNSVAFYDVSSGDEDCGVTLAIVDGQVILSYMPEDSPALYYFLNPADLTSPVDLPSVPTSVTISLPYAGLNGGSVVSYYDQTMVERIWDFYHSFQFDGPTELEAGDGLIAEVSFQGYFGTTVAHFQVLSSGKYTDFKNGYQILHNGVEIYSELYRLGSDANEPQLDPPETDDPAQKAMETNARSIVEQFQQGMGARQWLPLLNYMDWRALARAAVEAGMDDGDGSMAAVQIMSAIDQYIDQQGAGMTEGEYLSILSATEGLDGAPAEGYAYMLYRMYTTDYGKFGYVVLNLLPEAQRDAAIDLFRSEWMLHRIPYQDTVPSREEMIARLVSAQWESVYALPGGVFTFQRPGDTLQCGAANAYGVYELTFTSSHPEVATVDENGIVTSVSPGETDITIHYEGPAGQKDMHSYIQCDW